jgi:hypothetical protein
VIESETEPSVQPADLPKINPFLIPGREHAPKTALCPWKWEPHAGYYINVDNYDQSLSSFTSKFVNPEFLRDSSQLVLVTGDSGCGKSALRNKCAHWLKSTLPGKNLLAEIVDLTQEYDRAPGHETIFDVKRRMSSTGEQLIDELASLNLIDEASQEKLKGLTENPRRLYLALPGALDKHKNSDVVLLLLLPKVGMAAEVEEYAAMPGRRVVYFMESAWVTSRVDQIASLQGGDTPPVTLTVGVLNPGDARRFVDQRFVRGQEHGQFPGLDDEVVEEFDSNNEMSIAYLQSILSHMYGQAMLSDDSYVSGKTITREEAHRLIFEVTVRGDELR